MTIEKRLIKRIAKGDRDAFQRLYARYKDNVYNTALGYVQNKEAAEEVTQDVFLSIFQKADSFAGDAKVSTWVYRITVNAALSHLDRRARRPTADVEIEDLHRIDFNHPGVQLENQEKARYLFAAINTLGEAQKTAFVLKNIEGLSQQQVAEIMQVTVKSVESLLQRAKSNLKNQLNHNYPEGKS